MGCGLCGDGLTERGLSRQRDRGPMEDGVGSRKSAASPPPPRGCNKESTPQPKHEVGSSGCPS